MANTDRDCQEFYLHLSSSDSATGSPSNFSINLPAPRSLTGRWRLALKEMTFTQWNKERSFGDDMEFMIFARNQHRLHFGNYLTMFQQAKLGTVESRFTTTKFPGMPYAAVVTFFKVPGRPDLGKVKDPSGQFDNAEQYTRAVNDILAEMHDKGLFCKERPYFYLEEKGGAFKTVKCCWQYVDDYYRQIAVHPILSERNRHLLSIPDPSSRAMGNLMNMAMNTEGSYPDTEIGDEGFRQGIDNMFVLTDLVRTTGARPNIEGQILRAIPNRQKENGVINHHDFSQDYFEVTPKSSFFSVSLRLVSSRDYRDLNLAHPTSVTLHFKPMNQCQPVPQAVV